MRENSTRGKLGSDNTWLNEICFLLLIAILINQQLTKIHIILWILVSWTLIYYCNSKKTWFHWALWKCCRGRLYHGVEFSRIYGNLLNNHLPVWANKVQCNYTNLMKNSCPNAIFTTPPEKTIDIVSLLRFILKVVYTVHNNILAWAIGELFFFGLWRSMLSRSDWATCAL